jgi:hypothetical protein
MASNLENEEMLEAAIADIPRVAQTIATMPAEHRATAFDAAERGYLRAVLDLGYGEAASRRWVAAVMSRLRVEAEKERWTMRMRLKILYRELIRAGSGVAENDSIG